MRHTSRSVVLGIALIATIAAPAGCGGGSDGAQHHLGSLRSARCDVLGLERQVRALEAGIAATGNEFDAADPGPVREEILRSMRENATLIHRQLPSLERCPQGFLPNARDAAVPEPPAPPSPRTIAVAHRLGPPRIEPGEQARPASPCSPYGEGE